MGLKATSLPYANRWQLRKNSRIAAPHMSLYVRSWPWLELRLEGWLSNESEIYFPGGFLSSSCSCSNIRKHAHPWFPLP